MATIAGSERPIDFSTKAKYFVIGVAAAAALVTAVYFFVSAFSAGDRPPIIVKGGSVLIENQPLKGKSTGPGWSDDGSDWKLDQQDGVDVSAYLVGVVAGVSGSCEDLRGETVVIQHNGSGPQLTFRIADDQPKVGPKGQLTPETSGGLKRLRFGDESVRPTTVLVYDQNPQQGQSCELGANSQVWIWPVQ